MAMNPSVSVVMGVYNGDKHLREAVDSILAQTFADFEFIIINDGSTDGTRAILESYRDPRIVLVNQENVGLTKSLNRGMALAKGSYIARQDADDVSMPDRLQTQIDFLNANPNIALVGSAVQVIDGDGSHLAIFRNPCDYPTIREKLQQYNCFWHGSVIFRRSCLAVLTGYTELFATAQDYDLWLRFAEKYEIANLETPLYSYRFNPEAVTFKKIVPQRRMAEMARRLARARAEQLSENELLQGFAKFINSPLTVAEKRDIVQSYKPWCRLLLKKGKIKDARSLMTAIFRYHPSPMFRFRFAVVRRFVSSTRLEWILDHA
jgi:glycosyltransferase involved in cell wall biosynthesis